MAEVDREKESHKRSDVYLEKIPTFHQEDSDKPKASSVLGRQVGWGKDKQEAPCLEKICQNATVV